MQGEIIFRRHAPCHAASSEIVKRLERDSLSQGRSYDQTKPTNNSKNQSFRRPLAAV